MSVSLKLDKSNNLLYGANFLTIEGKESLVQDIKTSLSMTRGEYHYNIFMGIDYLTYLQNGDKQSLLSSILQRVLQDGRVATCDIETSLSGNGLQLNLTTTQGEASIELK